MATGPPPIPPELKYVAHGTYGCVVDPALPNNEAGVWKQYPGNVTKLFKRKKSYDDAIIASQKAYNAMGHNNGHRFNPYRHRYKVSNLPAPVASSCSFNASTTIFPLRMPNLGVDIEKLDKSVYDQVRKIPFGIILEQLLKCFEQVNMIFNAGYIHGDIRPTNVMINPKTGAITIIDFDWLKKKDDFYNEYPLDFYSNPPEALLAADSTFFTDCLINNIVYRYIYDKMSTNVYLLKIQTDYINPHNDLISRQHVGYFLSKLKLNDIILANLKNIEFIRSKQTPGVTPNDKLELFRDLMTPSFDLYGLAFTLLEFMALVYPSSYNTFYNADFLASRISMQGVPYSDDDIQLIQQTISSIVRDVLKPSISLELKHRPSIGQALAKMKEIVDNYKTQVRSQLFEPFEGLGSPFEGGKVKRGKKTHRKLRKIRKTKSRKTRSRHA